MSESDGPRRPEETPFRDIAFRLGWNRSLEGLTQDQHARKIGIKRDSLTNWESGKYRLSLDGALVLRRCFGLSLDLLFTGDADTLPMALRRAWLEREGA